MGTVSKAAFDSPRGKVMRREVLGILTLSCSIAVASCDRTSLVGPSSSNPLDQFMQGLRQKGFNVSLADTISPEVNRFFSVPAHRVQVNDSEVSAFEYRTSAAATSDVALISPDGQPNPVARFTWVSTPRFYHQNRLIVLYVGCTAEIVQALEAIIGPPIAIGLTPGEFPR